MKRATLLAIIMFSISISLFSQATDNKEDKTLSPYFLIKSDDKSIEQFPLLSTTADVKIYGVIAEVIVKQIYINGGKKPLEAIYVFPASTRAAVYSMTMKIQNRLLIAEIHKKEEARKIYEDAKKEGRSTSLLEQDRPNVFTMNVANIMPGDTITVEMKYTELLVPNDGIYEFVYPTVVGPRYVSSESAKKGEMFTNTPYTESGVASMYDFDINTEIFAGMPISDIKSKSHKIKIEFTDADNFDAEIKLEEGQKKSGNKDYILNYSLAGKNIQTGLLLSRNGTENFFLLMLQPPKKIETEQLPPREYVFILDVSGSMSGYPLGVAKKVIKKLLSNLSSSDFFNILLFAGSSELLSDNSLPATSDNIDKAIALINSQNGGGTTEILPALKKIYNKSKSSGLSRSIVIMTDGFVNVEEEVFKIISEHLDEANVFAFGIGTSVNRFLLEGIGRVGRGETFIVTKPDEADEVSEKFLKYIESPVLTDVKVKFEDFKAYDFEPEKIPDVMEQRPIILFGKWKDEASGIITVSGNFNKQELNVKIPVKAFAIEDTGSALKYLWARSVITTLFDLYNVTYYDNKKTFENKITQLGLDYNILTNFTSFVAVDYEIRNISGKTVKVKQPLPMPEGVSNSAIDGISTNYSNAMGGIVNTSSGFMSGADPLSPGSSYTAIYLGPNAGYNRTNSMNFPTQMTGLSPKNTNQNLSGDGYFLGLSYTQFFGKIIHTSHALIFNSFFKTSHGSNEQILKDNSYISQMVKQGAEPLSEIKYQNEFSFNTINFSTMYSYRVVRELWIELGLDFDFKISDNYFEKISLNNNNTGIIKPDLPIVRYEDNNKTAILHDGSIKDMRIFNTGILFGVKYDIITRSRIVVIPHFEYNLGLTKWLKDWKTNNFYVGIHLMFAI